MYGLGKAYTKRKVGNRRSNFEVAVGAYERVREMNEKVGNMAGMASTFLRLGDTYLVYLAENRGNSLSQALSYYNQALSIIREVADTEFSATAHSVIENIREKFQERIQTVKRHTKIEFSEKCYLHVMTTLNIQLVIESPVDTILKEFVNVPFLEGSKQSTLAVHVTAPAFKVTPPLTMMRVPVDQDSDVAVFEMTPIEVGKQVIEIEMFFRAERVGYFTFASEVVSNG
jgi:hypothetical protein